MSLLPTSIPAVGCKCACPHLPLAANELARTCRWLQMSLPAPANGCKRACPHLPMAANALARTCQWLRMRLPAPELPWSAWRVLCDDATTALMQQPP
eukprot:359532-Chlamydomonas_euryale.AAC.3